MQQLKRERGAEMTVWKRQNLRVQIFGKIWVKDSRSLSNASLCKRWAISGVDFIFSGFGVACFDVTSVRRFSRRSTADRTSCSEVTRMRNKLCTLKHYFRMQFMRLTCTISILLHKYTFSERTKCLMHKKGLGHYHCLSSISLCIIFSFKHISFLRLLYNAIRLI